MKTLLINPKFPPSYWTLKQSCELTGRKTLLPPLGLITVAALLPRQWELRLVDLNTRSLREEDWRWADLVMLSAMIVQKDGLLSLIREAKGRKKTVVVGGPYPTSVPQEPLEAGADFVVRGEAENTIPSFRAALGSGEKRGVFEADAKPEMISSPVPRFDLLNQEDYIILGIQTSRGCPFNCEFCDIVNLYGRIPRYKSPGQVVTELEALYGSGWRGEVFISDDNFIGNRDHAKAILDRLIPWMKSHGEPFSFWTQSSVNLGQDPAMMDLLTEANFSNIFVGIESPDPEVLTLNRKYQNLKNPLEQSLENIKANGLTVVASFILGFDQEKTGAGDRICAFVEKNSIPVVMLNTLQALPNTALWDRLKKGGRLLEPGIIHDVMAGGLNFLPTRPSSEIRAEYFRAVDYLYEPSRYLSRARRYHLAMRPTRKFMAGQSGKEKTTDDRRALPPLKIRLQELVSLAKLIWRQGVWPSYRFQFWKQLGEIYRKNPSRLIRYLASCGMGENLFGLREGVPKAKKTFL